MQGREKEVFTFKLQGREATFEVNSFPLMAERSVLCRYGDTTVLTTLCTRDFDEKPDFLHLTVFVNEKFYSIRKIPPVLGKREGRPGYESVIIARLIDRSLRSCLSFDYKKEIQITNTILSLGESHESRLVAF